MLNNLFFVFAVVSTAIALLFYVLLLINVFRLSELKVERIKAVQMIFYFPVVLYFAAITAKYLGY